MLDINNLSIDDIKNLDVSKLSDEDIKLLKEEASSCQMNQQAIKLIINSLYGAFGNQWCYFYNIDVAESITIQGKDAIKYLEKMLEIYFHDFFHKDEKLLNHLGIDSNTIRPLSPDIKVYKYCDTDSGYISLEPIIDLCNWQGDEKEFVLKVYEFRLRDYLNKVFDKYGFHYKTTNILDFKLETIAENAIFVAKKKYIQNIIWKDGKDYDKNTKIKTTGLEIIKSSSPSFCRETLKNIMLFILGKRKFNKNDISELVKLIVDLKNEFKLSNIEKISQNTKISDYNKFIINDTNEFVIAKKCPAHIRGGGYYNYLLNKNPKLKEKYNIVKSGDKARWYYTKDNFCNVFSYLPGNFPYEFAPPIDHDMQFAKTIIAPLNHIIIPTGSQSINESLVYMPKSLF